MAQWLKFHFPEDPGDSPLEWIPVIIHSTELLDLVSMGATALGAEGLALAAEIVGGPVTAMVGAVADQWMSLGAGYDDAKRAITYRETAYGYGLGAVMGADGVGRRRAAHYFGRRYFAPNAFLPGGAQAAAKGYKEGLITGYAEGRSLSADQRQVFWRDLLYHAKTLPGWNDFKGQSEASKQWSDGKWSDYYLFFGAVFRKFHMEGAE
ncbi:MAG TPA: hypothetical protein VK437_02840 [Steroidobacteraceae bacterium]|nr:hypothetical protein [Steroidobacteraceae bacterium]